MTHQIEDSGLGSVETGLDGGILGILRRETIFRSTLCPATLIRQISRSTDTARAPAEAGGAHSTKTDIETLRKSHRRDEI